MEEGGKMSIYGYYDGNAVRVEEPLQMNQKVLVIPIENDSGLTESAAGSLHQYANTELIEREKDAWKEAAIRKHEES